MVVVRACLLKKIKQLLNNTCNSVQKFMIFPVMFLFSKLFIILDLGDEITMCSGLLSQNITKGT